MSRTQFSLRMLFAVVAVVGIGAALWVAEPSWQLGFLQMSMIVTAPVCIFIVAKQFDGPTRAFCLGVSFATTLPAVVYLMALSKGCVVEVLEIVTDKGRRVEETISFLAGLASSSPLFRLAICQWSVAPVVGLLCVATHWLLVRPED